MKKILNHAGRRSRQLANSGFWIFILTVPIFLLTQDCIAQLKSIKKDESKSSKLKLYEGIEEAVDGYWETASQKFDEALEHNPQNKEAHLCNIITLDIIDGRLSEYYGEKVFVAIDAWIYSNNIKALNIFRMILETKKDYALIYLFKGMSELSMGVFSEAIMDFNKVIELEPDLTYVYVKRGQLYEKEGHYDLAIGDYNHAINGDSVYYEPYYERGRVSQILKEYRNSVNDYEQAYYLYPALKQTLHESLKICEGYNNLGMELLKNKNYPAALNNFNDAINWNSNFYEPYLNRGITYRNMQYYDAAISDFKKVIELDTTIEESYLNLAMTYKQMGQIDKTIQLLWKIENYFPMYIQAYQLLGEIYFEQRQFDMSSKVFEKLVAIDEKNYWGYYWMALSYDAEIKYPEAIKAYEIFIKIAPEEYYKQKIQMYNRAEKLKRWINREKR